MDAVRLLAGLRRGPGLRDTGATRALDTTRLRQLFGGLGETGVEQVVARLTGVIALLPERQQLVAAVEFGLHDGYRQDLLFDRQNQLATNLGCSIKTVQRQGMRALENLAAHLGHDQSRETATLSPVSATLYRFWKFPEGQVVAVTGELPREPPHAQPGLFLLQSRDSLAMIEAMVGVVTVNRPAGFVLTSCGSVRSDHLTENLLLVGGPRSNSVVRRVLADLAPPVQLKVVKNQDGTKTKQVFLSNGDVLVPRFSDGVLEKDLALVVVGRNPFAPDQGTMVFAALHSHGNHGAVAAVAPHGDPVLVSANLETVADRWKDGANLAMVVEVPIVNGEIVRPRVVPSSICSF